MTEKNAPHENETMHDADAVTEPEQAPEDGRFDIGEGVSGVAETDAETETDPANRSSTTRGAASRASARTATPERLRPRAVADQLGDGTRKIGMSPGLWACTITRNTTRSNSRCTIST